MRTQMYKRNRKRGAQNEGTQGVLYLKMKRQIAEQSLKHRIGEIKLKEIISYQLISNLKSTGLESLRKRVIKV